MTTAERAAKWKKSKDAKPKSEVESVKSQQSGDTVSVDATLISDRVVTRDDLLKKIGLDPDIWSEVEWGATSGIIWVKDQNDEPQEKNVWYVKARFKRIAPAYAVESVERLASRLPKVKLLTHPPKVRKGADSFLVIGMADLHFGKRCVDDDSSLNHTETLVERMVEEMLTRCCGTQLAAIYLVNLGDLLQIDTEAGTTTRGTNVESVATFTDIYEAAQLSVLRAITRCREAAPTTFITVPGNHDWSSCLHIASCAKQVFANTKGVVVDNCPRPRKYIHRGKNLIGMSHGNNEKPANLAGIMMAERPAEFASSSSARVFLKGHLHSKHAARYLETIETGGCCVYTLPSPAAIDSYHDRNGFVGNKRACQGFVFHDEYGLSSIHEVTVKQLFR